MSWVQRYDGQRPAAPPAPAPPDYPEGPGPTEDGLDLREALEVLWHRRFLVVFVLAACVITGFVVTWRQTPIFQATAKILVETDRQSGSASGEGLEGVSEMLGTGRSRSIQTQVEVLESFPILSDAMRSLGKTVDPDDPPHLKARSVKDTDVIRVVVEDPSPRFARDLANAVAKSYIRRSESGNRASAAVTRQFLEGQIAEKKRELDRAEERLRRFKEASGVTSLPEDITSGITRLNQIEAELTASQTEWRGTVAQLSAVQALLSEAERTYVASSTTALNPLVSHLEKELESLELERAALIKEYKPTTAEVRTIDDRIARARSSLQREAQRQLVASGETVAANPARLALIQQAAELKALANAQQARIAALTPVLENQRRLVRALPSREQRLLALSREVANLERTYTDLNSQYQEVSVREQAQLASASLLEEAREPTRPIRPRKVLNLALATIVGLMLGTMLAFLLDHLDDTVKSPDEMERRLGLPTLGVIPPVPKATGAITIGSTDRTVVAEAFRLLRSNIRFASPDKPLRSLTVTSANPGEGKSTTAVNLSIAMAATGQQVILVDCDLRRPSLSKFFPGANRKQGLTNVVLGDLPIEEALQPTQIEGLRVLMGGPLPPNPAEFLDSARCREVLKQLREMADLVVFDSPPTGFLTDGMVLATETDGVVLVACFGKTTRNALRRVAENILTAHGNLLGVCVNRVESSSRGYGGYYYYYHYHEDDQSGTPKDGNGRGPGKLTRGEHERRSRIPTRGDDDLA